MSLGLRTSLGIRMGLESSPATGISVATTDFKDSLRGMVFRTVVVEACL